MKAKTIFAGGVVLFAASGFIYGAQMSRPAAAAEPSKPFTITRLYTGPDGQTHAEQIEVKFGPRGAEPFKLMASSGAEIRRAAPGRVADWHRAPRRQYVITLSGHGEVELIDGTKIELGPGSIDLAEDLTGKGHITRVIGSEERVTLAIPVSEH